MTIPTHSSPDITETEPASDFYCSLMARQAGEQLLASAPDGVTTWVLLEYAGSWPSSGLPESDLSPALKEQLQKAVDATPGARFQFIRQERSRQAGQISLFVGLSRGLQPQIYGLTLSAYSQLLTLDLPALFAHPEEGGGVAISHPLYLVCTHGRRDACCAKWGLPLYRALQSQAGEQVWQTTHLGGHRFAPTLAVFPHGVVYGWLSPEDAGPLVQAHTNGRLYRLDALRGRSCYAPAEQAADHFLRSRSGNLALDAFEWVHTEQIGHSSWQVRFQTEADDQPHTVGVIHEVLDGVRYQSCGPAKPGQLSQFSLQSIE